jgi:hypothetical protein
MERARVTSLPKRDPRFGRTWAESSIAEAVALAVTAYFLEEDQSARPRGIALALVLRHWPDSTDVVVDHHGVFDSKSGSDVCESPSAVLGYELDANTW